MQRLVPSLVQPSGYRPLADYGLIGDTHTSALISRDGSIDWYCTPHVYSPAALLRLLDTRQGGYFRISPTDEPTSISRRYLDDTNILETTYATRTGVAKVYDFSPIAPSGEHMDNLDRDHCHEIVRIVEGVSGELPFALTCRVTPDYARTSCPAEVISPGQVRWRWSDGELWLLVNDVASQGDTAHAVFRIAEGQRVVSVLRDAPPDASVAVNALDKLAATEQYWRRWASRCLYDGPYRSMVVRSALTLKLLTFSTTGAIVAAPSCSLPEEIGGTRNWDYRYCWLRDATFTLYALGLLGYFQEAHGFMRWIQQTSMDGRDGLQIMYGVDGRRNLSESTLDHLDGYRGSRPVRIGNGAYCQHQLDVYGEVLDSAYLYFHKWGGASRDGDRLEGPMWTFLRGLVDFAAKYWNEPDSGIWEVRGGARHFLHSKTMCWVALDRGVRLAEIYGLPSDLAAWRQQRDRIRGAILERGYSATAGAFTQAFDSTDLDASVLLMPLVGFIPIDDPRMAATITAIQERLTRGGLVYRYLASDALPGSEGAFSICTFWLIDCLTFAGRLEDAHALFERMLTYANDLGLYSEEINPTTGEFLGNFPQGFTHIALINAAVNLEKARRHAAGLAIEHVVSTSRAGHEPTPVTK